MPLVEKLRLRDSGEAFKIIGISLNLKLGFAFGRIREKEKYSENSPHSA
jgi:hypothetical protein